MINHRNKQNYRFRTWQFIDRCHLKGGVRQGCFLSLILNYLIQYIHFHSLYITSHYYAKFKGNPCVGTDARPPFFPLFQNTQSAGCSMSLSEFINRPVHHFYDLCGILTAVHEATHPQSKERQLYFNLIQGRFLFYMIYVGGNQRQFLSN